MGLSHCLWIDDERAMFECVDDMLLTMELAAPLLRRWLVAGELSKRHHAAT